MISFKSFALAATLLTTSFAMPAVNDPKPDWAFSIYQTKDCNTKFGTPANVTGTIQDAPGCYPPMEFYYRAVYIESDAASKCNITFYKTNFGECEGVVAQAPGKIPVGQCYNFPADNIPTAYGITCEK